MMMKWSAEMLIKILAKDGFNERPGVSEVIAPRDSVNIQTAEDGCKIRFQHAPR
jgi:hypothetical protein